MSAGESLVETWRFKGYLDSWEAVRRGVVETEMLCFGPNAYSENRLKRDFTNPRNVVITLRDDATTIGYTYAEPKDHDTVYIVNTAIVPRYQKRGYLGFMMARLESELLFDGYKFMERDAAVDNGYADAIERHYKDRILEKRDHNSQHGPQRFFRIRLEER